MGTVHRTFLFFSNLFPLGSRNFGRVTDHDAIGVVGQVGFAVVAHDVGLGGAVAGIGEFVGHDRVVAVLEGVFAAGAARALRSLGHQGGQTRGQVAGGLHQSVRCEAEKDESDDGEVDGDHGHAGFQNEEESETAVDFYKG